MNISFKWIGGATWILQVDTVNIACDPVLCPAGHTQDYKYFKTKRINDPMYDKSDFDNVHLWLLTHNHEDHIDNQGLQIIHKEPAIISHKSLKTLLKKGLFNDVRFLDWEEETTVSCNELTIKIKALPAIHAKRACFSGMIGNGNGYLLEIIKNDSLYRIYVTGDSVYNKAINIQAGISCIDLVIANAGAAMIGKSFLSLIIGRITNSIGDIIKMNAQLKPKKIIPVHWGTFTHYSEKLSSESFAHHDTITLINPGERVILT